MTHKNALKVTCHQCGAAPGEACRNYKGHAMAPHAARKRTGDLTERAREANALRQKDQEPEKTP